jgi:hypothetical protein
MEAHTHVYAVIGNVLCISVHSVRTIADHDMIQCVHQGQWFHYQPGLFPNFPHEPVTQPLAKF